MTEQHSHTRDKGPQRSEHGGAENQKYRGQDHAIDHQAPGRDAPLLPLAPSTSALSLLGNPALRGRGNGPARIALMRQMQQTYGNRATRVLLQRVASTRSTNASIVDSTAGTTNSATHGISAASADSLSNDRYAGPGGTSLVIQRMKAGDVQVGGTYRFKDHDSGEYRTGKLDSKAGGWYNFENGQARGADNIESVEEAEEEEDDEGEEVDERPTEKEKQKRSKKAESSSSSEEPVKKRARKKEGGLSEKVKEKVVEKMVEKDQPKGRVAIMGRLGERDDKVGVRSPGSGTNDPGFVDTNKSTSSYAGIDGITEGKLTQSKVHDPSGGDKAAVTSHINDIKKLPKDVKNTAKQFKKENPHTGQTYGKDAVDINKGKKTTPSNAKHGETRDVAPREAHHKDVLSKELAKELEQEDPDTEKLEETIADDIVYTVPSNLVPDVKQGLQGATARVGDKTIHLDEKVQPKAVTVEELREQAEKVEEGLGQDNQKKKKEKEKENKTRT